LLQVIAAFGLGLAVLAIPRRLVLPGRLTAAAGAGFALATLGGYLLSVWIGLFGFKEVRTGAGIAAGLVEVAAFVVLAALALAPAPAKTAADRAAAPPARFPTQIPAAAARAAGITAAGLAVAALVLFGLVVAGASSPAPAATGTGLKTTTIGGTTVLTNAKGFTLYSFAPDTPATSKCYGSCAAYWPPVTGTPAASSALPGRVGTLKRTDGSEQLTYNGHPLYTYVGDSAPGQARGNNLNLNGGLWHEIRVSR
jgi:predicted lipoprotein with Yx(FWY)xxD motif